MTLVPSDYQRGYNDGCAYGHKSRQAEIDRLQAALKNARAYIVNCDHEPAVDEIDAALEEQS